MRIYAAAVAALFVVGCTNSPAEPADEPAAPTTTTTTTPTTTATTSAPALPDTTFELTPAVAAGDETMFECGDYLYACGHDGRPVYTACQVVDLGHNDFVRMKPETFAGYEQACAASAEPPEPSTTTTSPAPAPSTTQPDFDQFAIGRKGEPND